VGTTLKKEGAAVFQCRELLCFDRNYKTKAMEEMTIFRERQLEMQDKNV